MSEPTRLRLRDTTAMDLDFVPALEAHPDVEPFITPSTRAHHAEAIAAVVDLHGSARVRDVRNAT